MREFRALRRVGALTIVAMTATACPDASDPAAGDGRAAAVYASMLDWMVDEEGGGDSDERASWVLFVATRSEQAIGIDVQVAVVEALDSRVSVRFIDERAEAVDTDSEDDSVRDDGILVGLAAVPEEGNTVEVYADRYRNTDDVAAWLMTLRRSGDGWEMSGSPVPTDVRPLTVES